MQDQNHHDRQPKEYFYQILLIIQFNNKNYANFLKILMQIFLN